jgi:hypothetical protein
MINLSALPEDNAEMEDLLFYLQYITLIHITLRVFIDISEECPITIQSRWSRQETPGPEA